MKRLYRLLYVNIPPHWAVLATGAADSGIFQNNNRRDSIKYHPDVWLDMHHFRSCHPRYSHVDACGIRMLVACQLRAHHDLHLSIAHLNERSGEQRCDGWKSTSATSTDEKFRNNITRCTNPETDALGCMYNLVNVMRKTQKGTCMWLMKMHFPTTQNNANYTN